MYCLQRFYVFQFIKTSDPSPAYFWLWLDNALSKLIGSYVSQHLSEDEIDEKFEKYVHSSFLRTVTFELMLYAYRRLQKAYELDAKSYGGGYKLGKSKPKKTQLYMEIATRYDVSTPAADNDETMSLGSHNGENEPELTGEGAAVA